MTARKEDAMAFKDRGTIIKATAEAKAKPDPPAGARRACPECEIKSGRTEESEEAGKAGKAGKKER
jgi:hypothetical protein